MRIFVKVKPNSRHSSIKETGPNNFLVSVNEKPQGGKANQAVIEKLCEYFSVSKSQIALISGKTSRRKIFELS